MQTRLRSAILHTLIICVLIWFGSTSSRLPQSGLEFAAILSHPHLLSVIFVLTLTLICQYHINYCWLLCRAALRQIHGIHQSLPVTFQMFIVLLVYSLITWLDNAMWRSLASQFDCCTTHLVLDAVRLSFTSLQHFALLVHRINLIQWYIGLPSSVLGITLNGIHIFIVTGSFLYWCVMRLASQRFFIHSCIYLRVLIISYLATSLDTNSFSVLMCHKAVN